MPARSTEVPPRSAVDHVVLNDSIRVMPCHAASPMGVCQPSSVHACGAHRQSRPSSSAGYVSNNQKKKQHVGRCVPTPGFRTRAFAELCRWSKSRQSRGLCSESPVPTAQYNTVVPMIVKDLRESSPTTAEGDLFPPPRLISRTYFFHTHASEHTHKAHNATGERKNSAE